MKKVLLMVALVGLLAGPALAGLVTTQSESVLGYKANAYSASGAPRGTVYYDNTTTVTAAASRLNPPAEEIGDELLMTNTETVYLDSISFSVYNSSSSAGLLQTCDLTVNLYNYDLALDQFLLAGTLTYTAVDFGVGGLPVGYYTTFDVTDLYDPMNPIALGNDVLATLTISNLTGGSNRVGQVLADPPTVGSSADYFFRAGSWLWFGGNPVANFYWKIDAVPEPMTLALLAVGALALIRRR